MKFTEKSVTRKGVNIIVGAYGDSIYLRVADARGDLAPLFYTELPVMMEQLWATTMSWSPHDGVEENRDVQLTKNDLEREILRLVDKWLNYHKNNKIGQELVSQLDGEDVPF